MNLRFPIAALASASLLLAALPAFAQDSEAALRKRVDELEKRLLEVESQLKSLQQAPVRSGITADGGAPAASPSAAAAPAKERVAFSPSASPAVVSYPSGWLKVKEGLSQEEVKALIGPAHRSFELNGSQVWYYAYSGVGVGSVFFDSTGHASGYQKPSPRGLW